MLVVEPLKVHLLVNGLIEEDIGWYDGVKEGYWVGWKDGSIEKMVQLKR